MEVCVVALLPLPFHNQLLSADCCYLMSGSQACSAFAAVEVVEFPASEQYIVWPHFLLSPYHGFPCLASLRRRRRWMRTHGTLAAPICSSRCTTSLHGWRKVSLWSHKCAMHILWEDKFDHFFVGLVIANGGENWGAIHHTRTFEFFSPITRSTFENSQAKRHTP